MKPLEISTTRRCIMLSPTSRQTQTRGLAKLPPPLSHILTKPSSFFLEDTQFQHASRLQEKVYAYLATTGQCISWKSIDRVAQEVVNAPLGAPYAAPVAQRQRSVTHTSQGIACATHS